MSAGYWLLLLFLGLVMTVAGLAYLIAPVRIWRLTKADFHNFKLRIYEPTREPPNTWGCYARMFGVMFLVFGLAIIAAVLANQ